MCQWIWRLLLSNFLSQEVVTIFHNSNLEYANNLRRFFRRQLRTGGFLDGDAKLCKQVFRKVEFTRGWLIRDGRRRGHAGLALR